MIDWDHIPRIREHRQLGGRTPWFNGWPVGSLAIDPRGRRVLAGGERGLRLYEAATGELVQTFAGPGNDGSVYERIGFSADGQRAFAHLGGARGESAVGVWDVESGALERVLAETGGGRMCAIDRGGRRALARSRSADAMLWDLESGTVLRTMPRPYGGLGASVIVSVTRAVAATESDSAALWNLETGAAVWERKIGSSYALAAPERAEWFAAGGDRGTVRVHAVATGDLLFELGEEDGVPFRSTVTSLAVSRDGLRLAAVTGSQVRVWDVEKRVPLLTEPVEASTVVAIDPAGSWIVTGSPSGQLARFDLGHDPALDLAFVTRAGTPKPKGHRSPVVAVAFGPDGTVFSAEAGRVLAWSATGTSRKVKEVEAPAEMLDRPAIQLVGRRSPAWLSDLPAAISREVDRADGGGASGTLVGATIGATLVHGGGVWVWDLATHPGRAMHDLFMGMPAGSMAIPVQRAIALHPDERRLAMGSSRADAFLSLWDARAGTPIAVFEGHEADVTAVAFSPDGTLLASGSKDRTVRIWKIPPE